MPFFTGRAIHHCLEMYYRDGSQLLQSLGNFLGNERKVMGDLWPMEEEKVQEQIELMIAILNHYEQWVKQQEKSRWTDDNLEWLALETQFSVPIRTPSNRSSSRVYLAGRLDGVVRLKDDNSIWIWENKTSRSIEELKKSLSNDFQCGVYILAARELFDVEPQGIIYNILRKKAPTTPEVLNNGTLTKRANIDTTVQAYVAAIKEQHPDWQKDTIIEFYGGILQTLQERGNTFFARVPIRRTEIEVQNIAHDLWVVGLEMANPHTPIYPNESWLNCNFCPFRGPCLTLNAGGDYEWMLANEFQVRAKSQSWRLEEQLEQEQ
jgi:hypothetical protein